MIDAIDKAFADADRMLMNCKSAAPSVASVVSSSAGLNTHPLSLMRSQEQFLHFKNWTWSAVRLVAQRIAGQQVCVGYAPAQRRFKSFKRRRKSSSIGQRIEPLENHALLDVWANPNPWQSSWQLAWTIVASLEVTGRALLWVRPGDGDEPTEIYFIPTPWIIEIDPLQAWWKIRPTHSQAEFMLPGDQIVNLHYPNPEGYHPNEVISPLSRVTEAVKTDEQIQTAQHRAFVNGIYPSVILTAGKLPGMPGVPGERPTLTAQQREDLITALRQRYAGVMSAGEPLILDSLIEKVEKFSQSVAELDFSNSSKIIKSRILQAYGVSPILLGELENANRASSTVAEEIFVFNKINPLIEMISAVLTQRLAPMFATSGRRLVCWIEPAVPHDAENTLKQWDLGLRFGAVNRNDYRVRVLNMPAADGLDTFLEPAGMLPQADDDETADDATGKRTKVRRRKSDDDEIEDSVDDGICPDCGGQLDSDGVCEQCGEDWSEYKSASRVKNNGHRITITSG